MMIARRRRRGIASLDFAPRTRPRAHRWRPVRRLDHRCFTTIEGFSRGIMCAMRTFAPVRCFGLGIPNDRTIERA
jgi:hypothetical protein